MRVLLVCLAFLSLASAYCTVISGDKYAHYAYDSLQDAIARCPSDDDGIVHLLIQGEYPMSDLRFDMVNSAKGYSFMALNSEYRPRLYGAAPKSYLPPQLRYLSFFEMDFDFEGENCQIFAQAMINSTLKVTDCSFYNGICPVVWAINGTDSHLGFYGNTYCDINGAFINGDDLGADTLFTNNHDCKYVKLPLSLDPTWERDFFCRELFGAYIVNSCYGRHTPYYDYCLFSSVSQAMASINGDERKILVQQTGECTNIPITITEHRQKPIFEPMPLEINHKPVVSFNMNQLAGMSLAKLYNANSNPLHLPNIAALGNNKKK